MKYCEIGGKIEDNPIEDPILASKCIEWFNSVELAFSEIFKRSKIPKDMLVENNNFIDNEREIKNFNNYLNKL